MSFSFPKIRLLRRLCIGAAILLFVAGSPRASAILIIDQSSAPVDITVATFIAGDALGFEFTTPGFGVALEEIRGSWAADAVYTGLTAFQLFLSSGTTLTPVSTPVLATVPNTSLATFDFVTDATVVDFTSQTLNLTPNTTYVVMGVNNGSFGNFGMYYANGNPDPTASAAYDPVGPSPVSKFPIFDPAYQITGSIVPIPEPSSVLLILSGALLFLRRRR